MMDPNLALHRGHSGLTLLHSSRQVKQKPCRQESVTDLLASSPRQMAQLSGLDGRAGAEGGAWDWPTPPLPSLVASILGWAGGGVAELRGSSGGVAGQSYDDMAF